jgi:hypothetical protein
MSETRAHAANWLRMLPDIVAFERPTKSAVARFRALRSDLIDRAISSTKGAS